MFPENKWIPYRLEKVDLSHNLMPVLTKEVLTGTKHLKLLNVSHNKLNDLRKGVLPKMTSLEVLDLSGNVLDDGVLLDSSRVNALPNLTELYIRGNKFSDLPIDVILQMKNLTVLDASHNKLHLFSPALTDMIKAGMDLHLEG